MAKAIQRRIHTVACAACTFLLLAPSLLLTQQQKKPQAFKSTETAFALPFVLPSTLEYQLLEEFVLMQKANAGEAPAQHELGLRYLLGRGFPVDTPKAVYWIQRAADQQLPLAEFNLGLLSINGDGLEWNPFTAFKYFRAAATQEVPEAVYVLGLQYTEDFIVPRNWPRSYRYFKKAAELGFEDAKQTMKEMQRRGFDTVETATAPAEKSTASHRTAADTGVALLFIDFHMDTATNVADTTLIREAYKAVDVPAVKQSVAGEQAPALDSSAHSFFLASAEAGNPEALCLLGRCYEHGLNVRRDPLLAAVYYLRALHLDSFRAPALLWKLTNSEEFGRELELQSSKKNPDALYVWSGLTSLGFSKMLNEKQAFELLLRAAVMEHVPSMVELGSCYFVGRWTQQDRAKTAELWSRAASLGSREAQVRLAAANVIGQLRTQPADTALAFLHTMAKQGSLLSSLTLAYCAEHGICVPLNIGEAYREFHKCMERGSETAYRALRSMHDNVRPPDKEFQMSD